jgi:hypothetical protein
MASGSGSGAAGTGGKVYRVALLSNAMHQDSYARAFARHPRLKLATVIDEPGQERYVTERNRALAAQYGIPYVESLDALGNPQIDVVSVALPNFLHAPATIAALEADPHPLLARLREREPERVERERFVPRVPSRARDGQRVLAAGDRGIDAPVLPMLARGAIQLPHLALAGIGSPVCAAERRGSSRQRADERGRPHRRHTGRTRDALPQPVGFEQGGGRVIADDHADRECADEKRQEEREHRRSDRDEERDPDRDEAGCGERPRAL